LAAGLPGRYFCKHKEGKNMKGINILVVSNSEGSGKAIAHSIDNKKYAVTAAIGAEEAIEQFQRYHYDLAIFAAGLSAEEEKKLRKIFGVQQPGIILLGQNDTGENWNDKLKAALEQQRTDRKPGWVPVEDPLKNAGLNIIIQ
jgi:hypothetical protein